MDFLQIHQFYGKILPYSMPRILRLKNSPNLWQNITLQYVQNFKAKKFTKFMAKYYFIVCHNFKAKKSPNLLQNITLQYAIILRLKKSPNLLQNITLQYAIILRLKNSPTLLQNITLQYAIILRLKNHQIYCKCKIFLMAVYMIFKYSKRLRFTPLFNKVEILEISNFVSPGNLQKLKKSQALKQTSLDMFLLSENSFSVFSLSNNLSFSKTSITLQQNMVN